MKSFDILKQELKLDPIIFIQFPSWLNLALKLKEKFGYKMIFDCLDEFSNFPGVKQKRKTEEETLFEKSDLVLTTSSTLHEKSIKKESKSLFLPNAGEFEHFSKKTENLLHEYKKPIIGYFGSIAEWFDVELIEYLTKQRPDWTFIFIGHTFGSDIRKIHELPNVNFLGERPYSELPKYLHGFDVCLIPFKITPLTEATHPVKIYEYMATGKPVVSTKLKELQSMSDLCYIAENKEDFLSKIEKALNEKDKELRNKRIQFSSENTWNHRFETLYKELEKIEGLDLHHHN